MGKSSEMFMKHREENSEEFDYFVQESLYQSFISEKCQDDTAKEVLNSLFEGFYHQYNAINKINSKKI